MTRSPLQGGGAPRSKGPQKEVTATLIRESRLTMAISHFPFSTLPRLFSAQIDSSAFGWVNFVFQILKIKFASFEGRREGGRGVTGLTFDVTHKGEEGPR